MEIEQAREYRLANVTLGLEKDFAFTPLDGKKPWLEGWTKAEPATADQAMGWANAGNIGLRTGLVSGVVVVDQDPEGSLETFLGGPVPATVTANTGRPGGRHFYFKCPPGGLRNSAGKIGNHIDVRGDGGQVVFPGSIHPETGVVYQWAETLGLNEVPIAELPEAILKALAPKTRPATPPDDVPAHLQPSGNGKRHGFLDEEDEEGTSPNYGTIAMERELAELAKVAEGSHMRNHSLNKAAFSLGTLIPIGFLEESDVIKKLTETALSIGLEELETFKTITSGIAAGKANPRDLPPVRKAPIRVPLPPAAPPPIDPGSNSNGRAERPGNDFVLIPGAHADLDGKYSEIGNNDFADAVMDRMPRDRIYRRANIAGEVILSAERKKRIFKTINAPRMKVVVDDSMSLRKWKATKEGPELVFQNCTSDNAVMLVEHAGIYPKVRNIFVLTNYPIYQEGFTLAAPGWNQGSDVYYDQPEELKDLKPIRDTVRIRAILEDLVIDFPFKDEASKQNFFGLMLTPILRTVIENAPLHLILSSKERTGKSLLANEVLGRIICGESLKSMQIPSTEEERDKRITTDLMEGETLLHLDNLREFLDSAVLASLLTSRYYKGRILGRSESASPYNGLTIIATGNNVRATTEIVKRTVPIILQPKDDHPEDRNDFAHPNLTKFLMENRKAFLGCLIGMVENWKEAGQVMHQTAFGGFNMWANVVGGVLACQGYNEWFKNQRAWARAADTDTSDLNALVESWARKFPDQKVTPTQLYELAKELEVFPGTRLSPKGDAGNIISFSSKVLKRYLDAPVGNYIITGSGSGSMTLYYLTKNKVL